MFVRPRDLMISTNAKRYMFLWQWKFLLFIFFVVVFQFYQGYVRVADGKFVRKQCRFCWNQNWTNHSNIWNVLLWMSTVQQLRHSGLTAIGNSYQLRRRAAAAHVRRSDNTIYSFKAKCLAGLLCAKRWERESEHASSAAVYITNKQKDARGHPVRKEALHPYTSFEWIWVKFKCLQWVRSAQLHAQTADQLRVI